jgi:hypothetical protein
MLRSGPPCQPHDPMAANKKRKEGNRERTPDRQPRRPPVHRRNISNWGKVRRCRGKTAAPGRPRPTVEGRWTGGDKSGRVCSRSRAKQPSGAARRGPALQKTCGPESASRTASAGDRDCRSGTTHTGRRTIQKNLATKTPPTSCTLASTKKNKGGGRKL